MYNMSKKYCYLAKKRDSVRFSLVNFHRGHKITTCSTCLRMAGRTRFTQKYKDPNFTTDDLRWLNMK